MEGLIQDSPETCVPLDDSVQNKRYSRFSELVKLQYSGAEHGLVRGVGIVNLVPAGSAGDKKDDIDWVVINGSDEILTTQAAQEANDVRWQIEELHRGLKQLTGTEKCQYRKGCSQRNHPAIRHARK
jgi:hypothetical protein